VSTYIIVEEPPFTDAELQQVYAGIGAFDPPELGPRDHRPLAVAMRDAAGRLCGALAGATIWEWLHVDSLWVAPDLRGSGHGARLLTDAEQLATDRGCVQARLDTFDFQARGFYERHGWAVYAELPGFPHGHTQYHMRKALDRSREPAS
jgi:GNAT superfamily N-acetyltransferase